MERTKNFGNKAGANGEGILNGRIHPHPTNVSDNSGPLRVLDSMIKYNRAGADGGGIHNLVGSDLTLEDSTITRNRAGDTGGGVFNEGAFSITNTTIKKNTPDDCVGPGC